MLLKSEVLLEVRGDDYFFFIQGHVWETLSDPKLELLFRVSKVEQCIDEPSISAFPCVRDVSNSEPPWEKSIDPKAVNNPLFSAFETPSLVKVGFKLSHVNHRHTEGSMLLVVLMVNVSVVDMEWLDSLPSGLPVSPVE